MATLTIVDLNSSFHERVKGPGKGVDDAQDIERRADDSSAEEQRSIDGED